MFLLYLQICGCRITISRLSKHVLLIFFKRCGSEYSCHIPHTWFPNILNAFKTDLSSPYSSMYTSIQQIKGNHNSSVLSTCDTASGILHVLCQVHQDKRCIDQAESRKQRSRMAGGLRHMTRFNAANEKGKVHSNCRLSRGRLQGSWRQTPTVLYNSLCSIRRKSQSHLS